MPSISRAPSPPPSRLKHRRSITKFAAIRLDLEQEEKVQRAKRRSRRSWRSWRSKKILSGCRKSKHTSKIADAADICRRGCSCSDAAALQLVEVAVFNCIHLIRYLALRAPHLPQLPSDPGPTPGLVAVQFCLMLPVAVAVGRRCRSNFHIYT